MTSVGRNGLPCQRTGDEMMTDRIMQRLSNGGRTGVFLGAIAVVLIGLFLPGWFGAIFLLAIVTALGWLLTKTWPVATPQTRVLRVIILVVLLAFAAAK